MAKKKISKKVTKSKKLSTTKLMFLSFVLLFIIFEALYIVRNNQQVLQSNSNMQSVAGVKIEK